MMDPAPISPRVDSLRVGDTVSFTARLGEPRHCLPAGLEPAAWRWASTDTLVLSVDALTGVAAARAPGAAYLWVAHERNPDVRSARYVRVVAPP
jgi:hypothetical protein